MKLCWRIIDYEEPNELYNALPANRNGYVRDNPGERPEFLQVTGINNVPGPGDPVMKILTLACSDAVLNRIDPPTEGEPSVQFNANPEYLFGYPESLRVKYQVATGWEEESEDCSTYETGKHCVAVEAYNEIGQLIGASGHNYKSGDIIELAYPTYTFNLIPHIFDFGGIKIHMMGIEKIISVDLLMAATPGGEVGRVVILGDEQFTYNLSIESDNAGMRCVHAHIAQHAILSVHLDIIPTAVTS